MPVNRPARYAWPTASIAIAVVLIVPEVLNALANEYPPPTLSRQTYADPVVLVVTRLAVAVGNGLKSAVPVNWPVTRICPAGSTVRPVAVLVPPTERAMKKLPMELSFHRNADPPAAAVRVDEIVGSGLKSTAPVKVPATYTLPMPSKTMSAAVSLASPPRILAHMSWPVGEYLATKTSVPPLPIRLAWVVGLGSTSMVPENVPVT